MTDSSSSQSPYGAMRGVRISTSASARVPEKLPPEAAPREGANSTSDSYKSEAVAFDPAEIAAKFAKKGKPNRHPEESGEAGGEYLSEFRFESGEIPVGSPPVKR